MTAGAVRRVPLGAVLFVCALAATLIVAILVVRSRTPDLVLEVTEPGVDNPARFSPLGEPPDDVSITFFVREADPNARIGIVDRHEDVVRTLDESVALDAHQPVTYTWDGRTDAGTVAPPGRYRLLVDLPGEDREMIWPRRITIVSPAREAADQG